VHVAKLLNRLLLRPDIEVVVASLPELGFSDMLEGFRGLLFQHLENDGERGNGRLIQQQVDMLRHENVSEHHKPITAPYQFKFVLEYRVPVIAGQERFSSITTERDEVELSGVLDSDKALGHGGDSLIQLCELLWPPTLDTMRLCQGWGTQFCGGAIKRTGRGSWSPTLDTVRLCQGWGTQFCGGAIKRTGRGSWSPTLDTVRLCQGWGTPASWLCD
jgi:hypothetical protein